MQQYLIQNKILQVEFMLNYFVFYKTHLRKYSQYLPLMNQSYNFQACYLPSGGGCLIFLGNAGGISLLVLLLVLSGNGSEDRVMPKQETDINFREIIFTNIFVKLISRLNVNFAIISNFFLLQINLQLQKQFLNFAIFLIKKLFLRLIFFVCFLFQ